MSQQDYPHGPPPNAYPPPQYPGYGSPVYQQPPPPPPTSGGGSKLLLILLGSILGICVLCCVGGVAGVFYLEQRGLETAVVPGAQVSTHHLSQLRSAGLLQPGEEILHFYSPAIVNVDGGAYFVTDRHLVLYNKQWSKPRHIITFDKITSIEVDRSSSFFLDSTFAVHLEDGTVHTFPVSAEGNGDMRFLRAIEERAPNLESPTVREDSIGREFE
ncbi:MAG: hypothetical protein KF858_10700 [Candidatus Sumerlaeia bacterium]|nr:hypothetical protein [Candidatus Sumerlaeia bacterium]